MKKLMLILIALAVVCIVSYAHPESKVSIVKRGEVFRVIYNGPGNTPVCLTILDSEGKKVFTENIIGRRFMRPYNFSELPKGDYLLSVTDENGEHTEKINHLNKTWIARVSKIKGNQKKFAVTIPRQADSHVAVHVYDQHDQLLFSERGDKDQEYAKIYHLKNIEGATFHLVNLVSGEERLIKAE